MVLIKQKLFLFLSRKVKRKTLLYSGHRYKTDKDLQPRWLSEVRYLIYEFMIGKMEQDLFRLLLNSPEQNYQPEFKPSYWPTTKIFLHFYWLTLEILPHLEGSRPCWLAVRLRAWVASTQKISLTVAAIWQNWNRKDWLVNSKSF